MRRHIFLKLITIVLCLMAIEQSQAQLIYWTETTFGSPKLGKANADGTNIQTLSLTSATMPEAIVVRSATRETYWGELAYTGAQIKKIHLDLTVPSPIVTAGSVIRGIAMDESAGKMYWMTSNLSTGAKIYRANMDGSVQELLISLASGSNPRGIALDVAGGRMYWADFSLGKIQRANMTVGAIPSDVVTGLSGPVGIALDVAGNMMYWSEANGNAIKRSDLNGGSITTLVTGLSKPNYLAIDVSGGMMYWTEIGTPRIRKATLAGASLQTLPISVSFPGGIMVIPASLLPIQLAAFTGNLKNSNTVRLDWTTVSEVNNYGFYVERRDANTPTYATVSPLIPGNGTTLQEQHYSWNDENVGQGRYHYRLRQVDLNGDVSYSYEIEVSVDGATSVDDGIAPRVFSLKQNYPNPFNPTTNFQFSIGNRQLTILKVYDVLGREVATLVNEVKEPGEYTISWDARQKDGGQASNVPSGLYFYKLESGRSTDVKKMILMK